MSSGGRFINLSVGGFVYATTSDTITDSRLTRMFTSTKDSKDNYSNDRDGSLFRHILNFLRTKKLFLPQSFDEFEKLIEEARFYEVDDLIKDLQTRRESRRENSPPSVIITTVTGPQLQEKIYASGRDDILDEVFELGYRNSPDPGDLRYGYQSGREIKVKSKANAFDLLSKCGFQLEDCIRKATGYQCEYIFVRKNTP